ncbi:YhdP family protein [Candidatus Trichorickettsia mobilis]|nr:DUF3971 domain-containing protein [Candidatus Trichorickettsia mobilis]
MTASIIFGAYYGYFDRYIKVALESYLSNQHLQITIGELKTTAGIININKLLLNTNDNQQIVQSNVSINYNFKLLQLVADAQITFDQIDLSTLFNTHQDLSTASSAVCQYSYNVLNKLTTTDCNLQLAHESYLSINSIIGSNNIVVNGTIKNIPLILHKIVGKIFPENEVVLFIDEYIKAGDLTNGKFNLNLDDEFFNKHIITPDNLSGKFNVQNVEFKYDNVFPALKDADLEVLLSGYDLHILLKQAYSSKSLISNGHITLDWQHPDSAAVLVNAISKGPTVDLIDFVSSEVINELKASSIDLKKLDGVANSTIEIIIPLNPLIKNSYNISTEVSDANLEIFDRNLKISNSHIKGKFDGSTVILNGRGKINNFDSSFNYQHNLIDQQEFSNILQVKTTISGPNHNLGFVNLLSGNAIINLEYKSNHDHANISLTSDLKNLEFYLNKISIHKLVGEKANLKLTTNLLKPKRTLDFKLIGDNNLNLSGSITISGKKYQLLLPIITHYDTNIKGEVNIEPGNFTAKIQGSQLDLSQANMLQFLEKNKENTDTNLKVEIDRIKLKHNIWLDDVVMKVKCDQVRCFKGYLDSKIGSKFLKMLLKTFDNKEEWVITSNNVGAVFKSIGIFNDMKAGTMLLTLTTSRQQVKIGEIIPILDGSFTFRRFVVTNMPFLTKVVSFVSLPGFINSITNNKNIVFADMTGNFSYQNNIINISDAVADGPYFDFTMAGNIDINNHKIKLRGQVIPSLFGISNIIKHVPILGSLPVKGHHRGIFSAPYAIEHKY